MASGRRWGDDGRIGDGGGFVLEAERFELRFELDGRRDRRRAARADGAVRQLRYGARRRIQRRLSRRSAARARRASRPGRRTLGPSDSSDSGSDVAGARRRPFDVDTELDNHALETGDAELDSDTDRSGTGERASADGDSTFDDSADIEPDRTERVPRTKRGDD